MNAKSFGGYVASVVTGLILLAIVVLVALQWHVTATCDLYGYNYQTPTIWVVLVSVAIWPIFTRLAKAFVGSIGSVRKGRASDRARAFQQHVKQHDRAEKLAAKQQDA